MGQAQILNSPDSMPKSGKPEIALLPLNHHHNGGVLYLLFCVSSLCFVKSMAEFRLERKLSERQIKKKNMFL